MMRLALAVLVAAVPALAQPLQPGVVHPSVTCEQDAAQSYALYLPKAYTPDRRWPVIYAFDPMARGNLPVELMKAAAEKYGYIAIGSNNSRNGPVKTSLEAAQAIWNDSHKRFSIEEERRYATGFSGGARVATTLAHLCGDCIAGIVAHGAGFDNSYPPGKTTKFVFYGAAGNLDFNYTELIELDEALSELELPHRIRIFSGGHQYAPPEVWDEAFAWLELRAIRRGLRRADQNFIEQQRKAGLDRAAKFEAAGDLASALREYRALFADLAGHTDVQALSAKLAAFEQRRDVKSALKAEQAAIERQRKTFEEAFIALEGVRLNLERRPTTLAQLRSLLTALRSDVRKSKDENSPQVVPVRRTLSQILGHAIEMAQQAIRDKDYVLAITYLDLVIEFARAAPLAHYEKARALALAGRSKDVLPALRLAVDAGFNDPDAIGSTPEFASFKENAEFRQILDLARQER
jgi:dienelactone hydrolase